MQFKKKPASLVIQGYRFTCKYCVVIFYYTSAQQIQTSLMPSPGKIRTHPDPDNIEGNLRTDYSGPKAKDIGIIVFAAHSSGKSLVT
jgi:hypothetical protein